MGVSKGTKMTIRDLLQEELRKRGVRVVPVFSVSTHDDLNLIKAIVIYNQDKEM